MLNDRIVVRHIVVDEKPKVLHDCRLWTCIDLCGCYDEGVYHITGDFMLPGDIEILYIPAKYTRFQRFFIWLLKFSMSN